MRGRTNAEPNIGVQLNATTDTYEVAPNETILAGDFAEIFTQINGGIDLDDTNCPIFRLSDGKYIIGTSLYVDNGDHTFTRFGSTGITVAPQFEIKTDDFLTFTKISGYDIYYQFIHYDSENEYCITKEGKETAFPNSSVRRDSLYPLQISNVAYDVLFSYMNKVSNKYGNVYGVLSFSVNGNNYSEYSLVKNSSHSHYSYSEPSSSSEVNINYIIWAYKLKDDDYLIGTQTFRPVNAESDYYNYRDSRSKVYRFHYWLNYYRIEPFGTNEVTRLISATPDGYFGFIKFISGKLYTQYLYLDIDVDAEDGSTYNWYDAELLAELSDYDSANNYYRCSPIKVESDRNNYERYLLSQLTSGKYWSITELYFNTTSREMLIEKPTLVISDDTYKGYNSLETSYLHKRENNDFLVAMKNKLYEMSVSNHIVQGEIETHEYVKNANTKQYIMGVAKQSGTAGDTIEVYIPQVNS